MKSRLVHAKCFEIHPENEQKKMWYFSNDSDC